MDFVTELAGDGILRIRLNLDEFRLVSSNIEGDGFIRIFYDEDEIPITPMYADGVLELLL